MKLVSIIDSKKVNDDNNLKTKECSATKKKGWKRDNAEEINRHTAQQIAELDIVEFKEK